jgi:hypothetical protein
MEDTIVQLTKKYMGMFWSQMVVFLFFFSFSASQFWKFALPTLHSNLIAFSPHTFAHKPSTYTPHTHSDSDLLQSENMPAHCPLNFS